MGYTDIWGKNEDMTEFVNLDRTELVARNRLEKGINAQLLKIAAILNFEQPKPLYSINRGKDFFTIFYNNSKTYEDSHLTASIDFDLSDPRNPQAGFTIPTPGNRRTISLEPTTAELSAFVKHLYAELHAEDLKKGLITPEVLSAEDSTARDEIFNRISSGTQAKSRVMTKNTPRMTTSTPGLA